MDDKTMNSNQQAISKKLDSLDNFKDDERSSSPRLDEFASALPQWNLLPPSMVIKRVKRVL